MDIIEKIGKKIAYIDKKRKKLYILVDDEETGARACRYTNAYINLIKLYHSYTSEFDSLKKYGVFQEKS